MITLYSTWWVKPGHEHLVIAALQQLAKQVLKKEPGTLMYLVNSTRYDFPAPKKGKKPIVSAPSMRPGTIVFFEQYKNWDAFETHLYGPYFTAFVKTNKSHFVLGDDGEPFVEVVFLNQEVGFKSKPKKRKLKKRKSKSK